MKIAIHHRQGSFSDRWISYCEKNNIDYKIVNAFDSNIVQQLKGCHAFMWHHHHGHFKDVISAKKILFSLEHAGIKVFPNFKTAWHFDDKVAQKYLLEAINAPMVPSYVFYEKKEAINWANQTSYPKVFKLKGGAGAANVKLVKDRKEALSLINKAFSKGFPQFDRIGNLQERYKNYKNKKDTLFGLVKGIVRLAITTSFSKNQPPEKGYIYFQDFIPNNKTDFRIKVVNGNCWGFQRKVRDNDFRASGSGSLVFDNSLIPNNMLKTSLDVAKKIGMQSVAFDFVINEEGDPLIIEISYGFGIDNAELSYGYWDSQLKWYKGQFNPQEWMLEGLIKVIEES